MFASARCGEASAPTFTPTTTMRGLRRRRWNSLRECGVPRRKRATVRIVDRMVIGVKVDQCVPGKEKAGPCLLRAGLERRAAQVTRLPSRMPLAGSQGETALVRDEGVCLAREPSTMNRSCRAGAIHKFNNEGDVAPCVLANRLLPQNQKKEHSQEWLCHTVKGAQARLPACGGQGCVTLRTGTAGPPSAGRFSGRIALQRDSQFDDEDFV